MGNGGGGCGYSVGGNGGVGGRDSGGGASGTYGGVATRARVVQDVLAILTERGAGHVPCVDLRVRW